MAGKYDTYCVAMTGLRCLLPSFSKDPRPGINEAAGSTSLMMEFGEVEFSRQNCDLQKWAQSVVKGRDPTMQAEVNELFDGSNGELISLLNMMLTKQVGARYDAERALAVLGKPWSGKM